MANTNCVFLVSPRRFGKICLFLHLGQTLENNSIACSNIDLNAFPDLRSFTCAMTSLITKALETNTDRLLKIFSFYHAENIRYNLTNHELGLTFLDSQKGDADPSALFLCSWQGPSTAPQVGWSWRPDWAHPAAGALVLFAPTQPICMWRIPCDSSCFCEGLFG